MSAVAGGPRLTPEQRAAVERRDGDLLLDAGAGSGKTTVLVERFVRSVLEDRYEPGQLLTITFTEKAATELRARIDSRLREEGEPDAARAAGRAFISTIHGFCARVLRATALTAGLDPRFSVLDRAGSEALTWRAFEAALESAAAEPGGLELLATYGAAPLRAAVTSTYAQLRSAGRREPVLPELPAGEGTAVARARLDDALREVGAELAALDEPGVRVVRALERLGDCRDVLAGVAEPWPGELAALELGNGAAALSSQACRRYAEALEAMRAACARHHSGPVRDALDRLLRDFGARYEQAKRAEGAIDFEDLELLTRDLLAGAPEVRERLMKRFARVMVDELQDTNAVQLELIELVSDGNLFTVGDAQQSIYGFRHADVELFRERGRRLQARGARATLQTNFRSRPEILGAIERAFRPQLGELFLELRAGRQVESEPGAKVEVLLADRGGDWEDEGVAAAWRVAEARALATRVAELLAGGVPVREVAVLTRATTDMRVYERALEERGVPTYVIGGRGYWSHPQVVDVVGYLRALANPLDGEALLSVLASPYCGLTLDGLVVLSAEAREAGRELCELFEPGAVGEPGVAGGVAGASLAEEDRLRLARFGAWFAAERGVAARVAVEELIERGLERSGYGASLLALPGAGRRLANVRKLMRLAREHEAAAGADLRAFLEAVRGRQGGWVPDPRESEAPVEGEALDAVRLMTIHRAKGLEFGVTCVADLGRSSRPRSELLRVGRDGRLGLSLGRLGRHGREPACDHLVLGQEAGEREAAEERRLFYVAATRARDRLILSGAGSFERWSDRGSPAGWLAPALLGVEPAGMAALIAEGRGEREGVAFRFLGGPEQGGARDERAGAAGGGMSAPPVTVIAPTAPAGRLVAGAGATMDRLSYSKLEAYRRCGYRFYVEEVLGLPPTELQGTAGGSGAGDGGLAAAARGQLLHTLLERLDFRRPRVPDAEEVRSLAGLPLTPAEASALAVLVERFAASELCRRLAGAREVRREESFSFRLGGGALMTGAIDVLAREREGGWLVVDYKSDRIRDAEDEPARRVRSSYAIQQLVYALAILRTGAPAVEVAHVFLARPEQPVVARYRAGEVAGLEERLEALAAPCLAGRFPVTQAPRRAVCSGCPAEDGLCSWPPEMTRREEVDQLF